LSRKEETHKYEEEKIEQEFFLDALNETGDRSRSNRNTSQPAGKDHSQAQLISVKNNQNFPDAYDLDNQCVTADQNIGENK
jgi:hypothetical protein